MAALMQSLVFDLYLEYFNFTIFYIGALYEKLQRMFLIILFY